jgi:hypothetical protein
MIPLIFFCAFYVDEAGTVRPMTKNELLQMIYNEAPITEEQLKQMLDQTLCILTDKNTEPELIVEETSNQSSE